MATHHGDLVLCRKQPGTTVARLCERHDGICPICDSFVRPAVRARICDECCFGSLSGKCMICQAPGASDAYYCQECVQQEKDRDGCPRVINVGGAKTDMYFDRKKIGFKTKA